MEAAANKDAPQPGPISGIDKAWETLASMDPAGVARNSLVPYDAGCYRLRCLHMDVGVCPAERRFIYPTPEAEALIKRLGYFFNHVALWYLVLAKDIALTGRHVKPESLRGGQIFYRGTHQLPLAALAGRWGSDPEGFVARGIALGGRRVQFGDAAIELHPAPRIPVTLILWAEDDEFPARADLLFDSSVDHQLPLDISWSAAMLTVLPMLS